MSRAKAKAKGLPCPPEPLRPYTSTLNGKFVKAGDSQCYWGFPEPRFDPKSRTMVRGFKLLFDCNNKLLELKKEDINWVPIDWADYMNPNAMTTLLGDAIYNIEEEEYWKACQHALKSPYEARTNDEDEEGGEAPSDSDKGSNSKSGSSDSSNSDDGDGKDDSNSDSESNKSEDYDSQYSGNDWGEPPSDREDEDVGPFYEDHSDDDVDYYDGDIEDDAKSEPIDAENDAKSEEYELENVLKAVGEKVKEADNIDYNDYPYGHPSNWSCITDVSLRSGPRYDKHGREIPKLGSFHNSELGSLTLYTDKEDDINARLATLNRKLMIHNFKNLTLESLEGEDEKMEVNDSKYLP